MDLPIMSTQVLFYFFHFILDEISSTNIKKKKGTRVGPRSHREATFYSDYEDGIDYYLASYSKGISLFLGYFKLVFV